MAQFVLPVQEINVCKPRKTTTTNIYKSMYRFEKQRVEYLVETLLKEKNETQGGALSPIAYIQKMETYLRFVEHPGFQVFKDA
jgi:hypothetical protein